MGVVWLRPETATAEPAPEVTALRLTQVRGACIAPQYVAEELLRAEGFTDVRYVQKAGRVESLKAVASGEVPITVGSLGPILIQIDEGDPLVLLAGVHVGCFVLFATESVRTIRDLKGKTVGVTELGLRPSCLPRQRDGLGGPGPSQGRHLRRALARRVDATPGGG